MKRLGNRIIDDEGRTLILRGVNLGGSSKNPSIQSILSGQSGPSDPAAERGGAVSFIGRPFPAAEAEEHFERLKAGGQTFVRLVITWEALEHGGPGIYDEAYLAYLEEILQKAGEKGISVLMDPHQDAWSRWTGGDGAPLWTLEKLGMDPEKMDLTGAAVTPVGCRKIGKPYPKMIWPVNYSLYAAATMFTLFFAGKTFAPSLKIEGENVQDFLQQRYLEAFGHCRERLKNCRAIAGWEAMNEPNAGFLGQRDLSRLENAIVALGPVPSPFQAMIAASGNSVSVPVYTPWLKGWIACGRKTINPLGISLFKDGFSCPWKQAGVWKDGDLSPGNKGTPRLLVPDYFSNHNGRRIRFTDDFLKPFLIRFIERMSKVKKPLLFFIEGIPHGENPTWGKNDPQNVVNAFHHYDGLTLYTKSFKPWLTVDPKTGRIILGRKKTASFYSAELAKVKAFTAANMGEMPCFLGEFGLPFDINRKKAFKTGDYSLHEEALSLYYNAIDENLLGAAVWNYTADNSNETGDNWNGEDLSIVSSGSSGQKGLVRYRAEGGWLRPYPAATAGIPLKITWDRKNTTFSFLFLADPKITAPTEIFLPVIWFGENPLITVKGQDLIYAPGKETVKFRFEYSAKEQKLLFYNDGYPGEISITARKS